jgi:hypothetical protein
MEKVVIVLDPELPTGLLTNAAAVLAFSVAHRVADGVGPCLEDADGGVHPGITNLPIPILACPGPRLGELRGRAQAAAGVACVDFSQVAQRAKRYDEYEAALKATPGAGLSYLGLCIYGEPAAVRRLTGDLKLTR